jgi:hypothetical protein
MVNFILPSRKIKDFISDKVRTELHYWFKKNSIDVNMMTLDQAIDSGENFVYTLYPPENEDPWNVSEHIKKFSTELVDCINFGRCNLVINDALEGHIWRKKHVEIFINSLKEEVIDPSKVIVLSQSWSYIYNDMPFRLVHWSCPESVMSENAKPIDIPRHNFAKKFICLNFYNKQDRFYFIYQMYKNNLLDEFNFSHSKVTSEDDFDIWDIWPWTDDMTEFAKTTPHIYDNVEGPSFTFGGWAQAIEIVPKHRQDNYIYVVTESVFNYSRPYDSFDGMTRDTSEKTWKPIALKMPFIMLHQPYALKRLRDIGYKTFHTIWDESYDEIEDCNQRMTAIVDLVKSLSSREDFVDMIESCDDIVEHNFKMLKLRSPEQDMIREVSRFCGKKETTVTRLIYYRIP